MSDSFDNIDKQLMDILEKKFQNIKDDIDKSSSTLQQDIHRYNGLIGSNNENGFSKEIIESIYRTLLTEAHNQVAPPSVAFLGPLGTFSHKAALNLYGQLTEVHAQKTISDVFREVEKGNAQYGVVPVENSTEGAVTFTLDELVETPLNVIAESYLKISFYLLSHNNDIRNIKKIYTHPQPFGQSKEWVRKNIPDAEVVLVDSTTRAAQMAAEDKEAAAIASYEASALYSIPIFASRIEDLRRNFTRFFVIGSEKVDKTGEDKTSIVCAIKDKPAALLGLLKPFKDCSINMTRIESRPDKKRIWEYNFFIDFMGHHNEEKIKEALEKMREETVYLKILGSYPLGKQPQ
jgi:chorismate mutase/prephenate dehydratase